MRVRKAGINCSTIEASLSGCQASCVDYRLRWVGQMAASVALSMLCFGLFTFADAYGQEGPDQTDKVASQVCPDPPPQTSGSHVFRKLGETIDIPIGLADCQPVALVLHWSNGRNSGSLLNVTFLDSNNQPIFSRGVSVFQTGVLELPFASGDPQPWFATSAVVAVPKTVVIQTTQPFANPAAVSYTVTRKAARLRSKPRGATQTVAQPEPLMKYNSVSSNVPALDAQVATRLRTEEGRLLSQGQSSWASTGESVRYKLKEIRLAEPRDVEINGRRETVAFAYRLTLSGADSRGSQRVGTSKVPTLSRFGLIWLDDAALPAFSLDAEEVSALIFDRSILREGAEIAVSNSDGSDMHALVERLKYQSSVQSSDAKNKYESNAQGVSEREEGNEVVSIRNAVRVIGATRMPLVQIQLRTKRPFPLGDSALQLQIGKRFFLNELTGDVVGRTLTLTLTQEAFAELQEGSAIVAFYDKPDRSGFSGRGNWNFGKLDKSRRQEDARQR